MADYSPKLIIQYSWSEAELIEEFSSYQMGINLIIEIEIGIYKENREWKDSFFL